MGANARNRRYRYHPNCSYGIPNSVRDPGSYVIPNSVRDPGSWPWPWRSTRREWLGGASSPARRSRAFSSAWSDPGHGYPHIWTGCVRRSPYPEGETPCHGYPLIWTICVLRSQYPEGETRVMATLTSRQDACSSLHTQKVSTLVMATLLFGQDVCSALHTQKVRPQVMANLTSGQDACSALHTQKVRPGSWFNFYLVSRVEWFSTFFCLFKTYTFLSIMYIFSSSIPKNLQIGRLLAFRTRSKVFVSKNHRELKNKYFFENLQKPSL